MIAQSVVQRLVSLIVAVFVMVGVSSSVVAQSQYVQLASATDLATNQNAWQAHIGLYVAGEVPLRADQLTALGQKLHDEHPLWTVVLVGKSEDSVFRSANGLLVGEKAVEFALGQTLFNSPGFKHPTNERSGLPERSILCVTFDTRGCFCFTSPHHESFTVSDERVWVGINDSVVKPNFQSARFDTGILAGIDAVDSKLARGIWWATWFIWIALGVVLLVAAVVFAVVMTRRRLATDRARSKALQLVNVWEKSIQDRFEQIRELDKERARVFKNPATGAKFGGRTEELLQSVIASVDNLYIGHGCLAHVLATAQSRLPGKSLLAKYNPLPYETVVSLLEKELIDFDPQQGLHVLVDGERKSDRELLWAPIATYQPFKMTFEALVKLFGDHAKSADAALKEAGKVIDQADDLVGKAQAELNRVCGEFSELAAQMGGEATLLLPNFLGQFAPTVSGEIASALEALATDPKHAFDAATGILARISSADGVVSQLRGVVGDELSRAPAVAGAMKEKGLALNWIQEEMVKIAARANDFLAELAQPGTTSSTCTIEADFNALMDRCAQCTRLAASLLDDGLPALEAARTLVKTTREQLLEKVRRSSHLLNEGRGQGSDDRSPSQLLDEADKASKLAISMLNRGMLDEAEKLVIEFEGNIASANSLVHDSVAAAAGYDDEVQRINLASDDLDSRVGHHEGILREIQSQFAPSVLAFRSGEPRHPDANGTVGDNLDEIAVEERSRNQFMELAAAAYESGQFLASKRLLADADGCNSRIAARQEEIRMKMERLVAAVDENQVNLQKVAERLDRLVEQCNDRTVQRPTQALRTEARRQYGIVAEAIHQPKSDPFAFQEQLRALTAQCDAIDAAIKKDALLFQEAKRSAHEAIARIRSLLNEVAKAQRDDVADSERIRAVAQDAGFLEEGVNRLLHTLDREPHGKWGEVDAAADQAHNRALELGQSLRGEVEKGRRAVEAKSAAAAMVKKAVNWPEDGGYTHGVSIGDSYGSSELRNGNAALASGDYETALRRFDEAETAAKSAISRANKRVAQARREAQILADQAAAALAAAVRQASRPSGGGGSFGGGGSSPSVSRPSFGSSSGGSAARFSAPSSSGGTRGSW